MRRDEITAQVAAAFNSAGIGQSELARRMRAAGHENYTQMTASRTLSGQRAVPAHEYATLLTILPDLPPIGADDPDLYAELIELRAFKRRVLNAINP